ncbi:hypothetical protein P378_16050 [Desulforamulus profundi]|uniref:Sporulation protein YjcZ n=1 Tax=Desulforamulus profundi TaxID=1383067 RepID=A0A2C6M8J1_9FIRM|nr:hypothetical protein P378_16050 [Desulforamulus profundi]
MPDGYGYGGLFGSNFAFIIFLILILLFFGQGFYGYSAEK